VTVKSGADDTICDNAFLIFIPAGNEENIHACMDI